MKKIYEFTSPCDGEEPLKVIFVAEEEELENIRFQTKEDTLVVLSEDQEVVNAAVERVVERHILQ